MNTNLVRATGGTGSRGVCVLAEAGRVAGCARDGRRAAHSAGLSPGSRWYVGIEDKLTLARLGVAIRRGADGVGTVFSGGSVPAGCEGVRVLGRGSSLRDRPPAAVLPRPS